MMKWLNSFNTQINIVDEQHKKLFVLLSVLCNCFEKEQITKELLNKAFNDMTQYAHQHFVDEEALMMKYEIDERHIHLHQMEHHSFMYDTQQMGLDLLAKEELDSIQLKSMLEKLIRFITAWLTFHILGMDQLMAAQIRNIEEGIKPEVAYDTNHHIEYDTATTRIMLDSVFNLWRISTDRCHQLEMKLAAQ